MNLGILQFLAKALGPRVQITPCKVSIPLTPLSTKTELKKIIQALPSLTDKVVALSPLLRPIRASEHRNKGEMRLLAQMVGEFDPKVIFQKVSLVREELVLHICTPIAHTCGGLPPDF
jgi:hypothetical protein